MKRLFSVLAILTATSPAFTMDRQQCLRWKYICVEKDEFGTCIAWETQCMQWGAPIEGPGSPKPIDENSGASG